MKSLGKTMKKSVKAVELANFVNSVKKALKRCLTATLVQEMCVWIAKRKDIVQFVNKVFVNCMKSQQKENILSINNIYNNRINSMFIV